MKYWCPSPCARRRPAASSACSTSWRRTRRRSPSRRRASCPTSERRDAMFDHDETLEEARERNIRDALFEDIGRADHTGLLVPAGRRVRARVKVREEAVLCGRDWFEGCVKAL